MSQKVLLITGSAGLIGSEASLYFGMKGYQIIGIDNDLRATFFGPSASTRWQLTTLASKLATRYQHYDLDIRNNAALEDVFKAHGHSWPESFTRRHNRHTIGRPNNPISTSA